MRCMAANIRSVPTCLEVVSYIGAAVVTRGTIRIRNAGVKHLEMVGQVFHRFGVHWQVDGEDIIVPSEQSLNVISDLDGAIPEIKTNVWPAFPTDLTSIAITVATQTSGSVLFHDWMFSGRMYFTDKLVGMGARIILCDPYRCLVQGPNQLYGEKLESPDIRAGMALLIAALAAEGESTIRNIVQIERGYERVDEKFALRTTCGEEYGECRKDGEYFFCHLSLRKFCFNFNYFIAMLSLNSVMVNSPSFASEKLPRNCLPPTQAT
jgi:UDP-N-acetylglucosamine 1-carboxyvinyltransferase